MLRCAMHGNHCCRSPSADMPVPASKLLAPKETLHSLQRPRLLSLLASPEPVRLVVIQAPAGSGKTTLMRQWYSACCENRSSVVWVNLDSADNDVERFSELLFRGFKSCHPAAYGATLTGEDVLSVAGEQHGDKLERLPEWRRPFTLFLDEFEVIHHKPVLQYVRQLIEGLPSHGQIVIGSREIPDVGMARLQARGRLRHIDAVDLRFSQSEAAQFLREKQGLSLQDRDIATLTKRTEGWAAALYLSSLSLGRRSNHAAFVASFSGSNVAIATYLAQDVFAYQAPDVQHFLLCSSVLSRLCSDLCDAVMSRRDSAHILAELEKKGLFLHALDDSGQWFRYHSLFAGFLQQQLDSIHPGLREELHRRAARWLHQSGDVVSAIEYLLLAGAHSDAIALIAHEGPMLLEQGRIRLMSRWFEQIGPVNLQAFPQVYLLYAWTQVLTRRCEAAMQAVEYVLHSTRRHKDYEMLALEAGTIRCMALNMSDQMAEATQLCKTLMASVSQTHVFHYGALASILSRGLVAAGRYEDARQVMSQAIQRHERIRPSFFRSVVDCIEASIDITQARFGNARARLQRAAEREAGLMSTPRVGGRATIAVRYAGVLFEMDELEAAGAIVDESMPYIREHGTSDSIIAGSLVQARVAIASGDTARARDCLVALEETGREMQLPRVSAAAWLERGRIATVQGDLAGARDALSVAVNLCRGEQDGVYPLISTQVDSLDMAQFRLAIVEGQAGEVASEIRQAIGDACHWGRYWRAFRLRLLLAMALGAMGEQARALSELTAALQCASQESLYRPFIDEGQSMARLLHRWSHAHPASQLPARVGATFMSELLQKVGDVEDCHPIAQDLPVEDLTRREAQVLGLLANGDETRTIAHRLFVSEATIKTHLRNIYTKLGAKRRTQALAIARKRGLVS